MRACSPTPLTMSLPDSARPVAPAPRSRTGRLRVRAAAARVAFGAQAVGIGIGASEMWRAHTAGQATTRPGLIAFWAGVIGMAATLLAPRIRAHVQRQRARHT